MVLFWRHRKLKDMILATHGFLASSIGQFDADAIAFFNRVTTAGGTLSATERNAVNTLVIQMKTDGIWTKMKAIYPMVGASAAACAQNLKSSSFTGTFTSGWTFASTGVTTNGSNTHFNTTLNPSTTFGSNYSSFGVYWRNTFNAGEVNIIGCDTSGGQSRFDLGYSGTNLSFVATSSNGSDVNATETSNLGFLIATRQGLNINKLFRNNILKINGIQTFATYCNRTFWFGARNGDTADYFANNQNIAFGFISDTLTDTDVSNYTTAVQAFQTTLSRNV
jgi:hypothetical protein